jgi:orotate phosphoribosyltransferase
MKNLFDIKPEQARAEMLVLIREVAYAEGDFTLASGKKSKYYIDGRRATIHQRGAVLAGVLFLVAIRDLAAGYELYPVYCRKEPKGHGAGRQLEGYVDPVKRCVVVEDTATTGASALKAAAAARAAGIEPLAVVLLVDRGEGAREAVEAAGLEFRAVFTVQDLKGE